MPFLKPTDPIPDSSPDDHHVTIERRPDGLYDVRAHGCPIEERVDPLGPARGVVSSMLLVGGLILAVIAGATKCSGLDTNRFLAAVALVESSTPGHQDRGRAVGPYQMHRAAYLDVIREVPALAHVQHRQLATNKFLAKRFAEVYTCILSRHIIASGGRSPTPDILYAAWNSGISRLRARGFSLSACPRRVREAAQRVSNLYHQ